MPAEAALPIPAGIPTERAVLAAQMETALNATWDAAPCIGDRIAVVGAGVIGCLVGYLCGRLPRNRRHAGRYRRRPAGGGDCPRPVVRDAGRRTADAAATWCFTPRGRPTASISRLSLAGFEASVIELSWYGTTPVPVGLGGSLSQPAPDLARVAGRIGGAGRRARWSTQRRLALALVAAADPRLDVLVAAKLPSRRCRPRCPRSSAGPARSVISSAIPDPEAAMYAVEVRDHIMIAHSLPGDVFGPAQRLHGATFVVDVAFFRSDARADNIVVDIGLALQALRETLAAAQLPQSRRPPAVRRQEDHGEFMARDIFDAHGAKAIRAGRLGAGSAGIDRMRVTLNESHVARAWYEAAVGA